MFRLTSVALLCISCCTVIVSSSDGTNNTSSTPKVDAHFHGPIDISSKKSISIMGILPFGGTKWPAGDSLKEATEMAREQINEREDILPGYDFQIDYEDGGCDEGKGIWAYTTLLMRQPTKLMVVGPACTVNARPIAAAAKLYGHVVISYGAESELLSDKTKFPYFMRTVADRKSTSLVKIEMCRQFKWKKIAIIYESGDMWPALVEGMLDAIHKYDMEVIASFSITDQVVPVVEQLKNADARIIITGLWETTARKVLCAASKLGLYGGKYAWFFEDWYSTNWLNHSVPEMHCSPQDLIKASKGYFTSTGLMLTLSDKPTVSGMNRTEFLKDFNSRIPKNATLGLDYGPPIYDAVWIAAMALNKSLFDAATLNKGGIEAFKYGELGMTEIIWNHSIGLDFESMTMGRVKFESTGDPRCTYQIRQYVGGVGNRVALYDKNAIDGERFTWSNSTPIFWALGRPPYDQVFVETRKLYTSPVTYVIFCAMSASGIVMALFLVAVNIAFRNKKIIKMSSPNINNVILLGCIIEYCSIFFEQTQDIESQTVFYCRVKRYLLFIGFSISFGALLSKTWRVWKIFSNIKLKMKPIKDRDLLMVIVFLVMVNFCVLILWDIIDFPHKEVRHLYVSNEGDYRYIYETDICTSKLATYFLGPLLALQGVLVLLACFLAFETRQVKVESLNDSKSIGHCVYNILLLATIGVPMNFMLENQREALYILSSFITIAATTAVQCLIFIPKLKALYTGGGQITTMTTGTTISKK